MSTQLLTFDQRSQAMIAEAVRRLRAEPRNTPGRDRQWPGYVRRGEQFGVTATCQEFPTYPLEADSPDTYVVCLQEWHFTEEPGAQVISKISWAQYVVARVWNAGPDTEYIPEGTPVHVWPVPTRRGIRWWMEAGEAESSSSPPPPPSSSPSSEESSSPASSASSEESSSPASSAESSSPASSLVSSEESSSPVSSEASSPASSEISVEPSSEISSGWEGQCVYQGQSGAWVRISQDCDGGAGDCAGCDAYYATAEPPQYEGELAFCACGFEA